MIDAELADLAKRAEKYYEEELKADLERTHWGWIVAIEPTSGDYFLGRNLTEAGLAAEAAHPDRLYHAVRVGYPVVYEIGGCYSEHLCHGSAPHDWQCR
jgi:hypothetical protein